MRLSQFPLTTLKDAPADAEVISHQLMLRSGMVRRLASGLYSWLPLGLRVLRRVETIVREEMNRAGALELLMPSVQPAELWQESRRWEEYGPELLRFQDRHERDFCYGPTHEEVVTDIARRELTSYRQLPVNYYQIQTKFRDEIRPRFGVMRAREFLMKDAYSFHLDEASLEEGYQTMRNAYQRVFERLGLSFRIVSADSGSIGGNRSEEFHVLAESGEDAIAYCDADGYAANVELTPTPSAQGSRPSPGEALEAVATPQVKSIEELTKFLEVSPRDCIKTLLVAGADVPAVALLIRGDRELNRLKAEACAAVATPLRMLSSTEVADAGTVVGFAGPVGLAIPVVADHEVAAMGNFVCGANEEDKHYRNVNFVRDLAEPLAADLRNAGAGDPSPAGGGTLSIARGIEVGHIFQLGTKYSEAMDAWILDDKGEQRIMHMGCYGIGVSRVVAAAIEQNHDDRGILWPEPIAPFDVTIVPINFDRSESVRVAAEALYGELAASGLDVLLDDRNQRPGFKFADADLMGIPHRIVVSEKGLAAGTLEYKSRRTSEAEHLNRADLRRRLLDHADP